MLGAHPSKGSVVLFFALFVLACDPLTLPPNSLDSHDGGDGIKLPDNTVTGDAAVAERSDAAVSARADAGVQDAPGEGALDGGTSTLDAGLSAQDGGPVAQDGGREDAGAHTLGDAGSEPHVGGCVLGACENGGTCIDDQGTITCTCQPGFGGERCEVNIDDCSDGACQNGGVCQDAVNGFHCACPLGFTGLHCETNLDDCTASACLNGGSCIDGVNSFSCVCPDGYAGSHCEMCPSATSCTTDADDCQPNPCFHDGVCTDGVNAYQCSCPTGYSGARCEVDINECAANQCKNGSTCVDGVGTYSCSCPSGFSGTYCQTNLDDCGSNQCQNGAACVDGLNSYSCSCLAGYSGTYCQTNIDDCAANPCKNGGTCTDGVNAYTCSCKAGYTGATCQTNIDECSPNPCQNGGTCTDGVNAYSCACKAGYTGSTCETNIDDCATSPCQNGGTCIDGVNAFTCSCAIGRSGSTCSDVADPCDAHPCQNDGVCINGGDGVSYQCACPNGFTGTECESVSAATTCSNLWSSVLTFYNNAVTLGGCDAYPAAREIVGSLMNLENQTVTINSKSYAPCVDFRCDSSYVYVVSTNLPFYDPPSWLPGATASPPSTNLIFRIPFTPTKVTSSAQYVDVSSLGASCDDAYQYMVGLTTTELAQEPYGFCTMSPNGTKYVRDGSTYYRRTNCLIGNGVMINGEQIYGSNEAKAGDAWGNPAFYYPDVGTSSELYYKSSSGSQRPGLDLCGTHFHHHGINASCYERDGNREPIHTSYTNADVKGLFDFAKWIYDDTCSDESEIVGWMPDGIPIKGPCVCMARDSDGLCTDARHVRSSYVYTGLNAWKGSASSSSSAATDLASYEGKTCTSDSQCGTSGNMECTWSVFDDASVSSGTVVEKRCVTIKYAWCNHIYHDRSSLDTTADGIQYLDRCNGVQSADGYAYHATGSFPYLPSCMRYEPSSSIQDSTL